MHMRRTGSVMRARVFGLLAVCAFVGLGSFAPAAAQTTGTAVDDGVRDHIGRIEDTVDRLLDWRHVLSARTRADAASAPTAPATTLITVDQRDVNTLVELIDATANMLPAPAAQPTARRGDLRAHVMKAREIAREMMPSPAGTTGTSGQANSAPRPADRETVGSARAGAEGGAASAAGMITIDRTSLERLKVEVEAMENLARREPR
jgi:hypothetical protein